MPSSKNTQVQDAVKTQFSQNETRPTSLTELLSSDLPDEKPPETSGEPEQVPNTKTEVVVEPEKKVENSSSNKMKYPWQKFNPNDKTHIAGRQITSVDLNDYELAVLEFLASEDVRDTSVRKEARRLLRPAILRVAQHIEESGVPEW